MLKDGIQVYFRILYKKYYQVFLVAGGSNKDSVDISSTETLVEGGTTWNFQKPLPSERKALRGVSLVDTVIMTGRNLKLIEVRVTVT